MKWFKNIFKKSYRVFSKEQKKSLWMLICIIGLSSLMELVCVPVVLPLVNLATYSADEEPSKALMLIEKIFGFSTLNQMAIFAIILVMLVYLLKNIVVLAMNRCQFKFVRDCRRQLSSKLMDIYIFQPYMFHKEHNVAEIQRDIDTDVSNFCTMVLTEVQLVSELSVCLFIGIYLFVADPISTLFITIVMGAFLLVFMKMYKRRLKEYGSQGRESYSLAVKWILQVFGAIKEIKANSREKYFKDRYNDANGWYLDIQFKQSVLTNLPKPLVESIGIFSVLLIAIIQILGGENVVNTLTSLAIFLVAALRLMPSFNRISGYITTLTYYTASLDAINAHISLSDTIMFNCGKDLMKFDDCLEVKNVSFEYEEGKPILEKANILIKKHTSVAFVGPSGAGKSTMADIILGLLHAKEGVIYVDGIASNNYGEAWHNLIGYIPQEVYLLDDTIRANIAFGVETESIDEELLEKVVKNAQLDEFISTLEKGLDTIIGENGARLSGGQKQRVGIARALYKNPEILILDEATSALDNGTESAVMEAIENLHGKMTIIIIAHRLSTIRKCDEIYEIKDGVARIIEGEEREDLLYNKNLA